jgi:hypothetical protein
MAEKKVQIIPTVTQPVRPPTPYMCDEKNRGKGITRMRTMN